MDLKNINGDNMTAQKQTTTQQKPWQKGFELSTINAIKSQFQPYNSRALSPFSQWNGPKIADSLAKGRLVEVSGHGWIDTHVTKTSTEINMYYEVVVGRKLKGDRVVNAISGATSPDAVDAFVAKLNEFTEPTWFMIWEEDASQKAIARKAGFKKIGVKITAFAEIYGVYFRDRVGETRAHIPINKVEYACLLKLNFPDLRDLTEKIADKIPAIESQFKNHYSKYNKGQSWGAISLRGYSSDITMIEKPSSMSESWQKEHENENFFLQDTSLRADFPEVEAILSNFPTNNFDRIRLMKLAPGGGELSRHVDAGDAGVVDGAVMRFHIPIITNPKVIFTMWDTEGEERKLHMKEGEAWLFDMRKPHMAVNGGDHIRIHLVIDVIMDEKMRSFLASHL